MPYSSILKTIMHSLESLFTKPSEDDLKPIPFALFHKQKEAKGYTGSREKDTVVSFGIEKEFSLRVPKGDHQKSNWDCGQKSLQWLGIDGYKLFPDREVFDYEVGRLFNDSGIELDGSYSGVDFSNPHLVLLRKTAKEAHRKMQRHWVIRVEDTIICPSVGVVDAKEYLKRHSFEQDVVYTVPKNCFQTAMPNIANILQFPQAQRIAA